jgi:putative GTP pyrophosphokinase
MTAGLADREQYNLEARVARELCEEVVFTLRSRLDDLKIKPHSVASRVKGYESLQAKAQSRGYSNPISEVSDLAGVRVVTLFLSDLSAVCTDIGSTFSIIERDDKLEQSGSETFGYSSVHFVCELDEGFRGTRYDRLRHRRFEIQVRTLLMDAWANVSHYLDYKGEASIPSDLRRDFHALSGLFYVADRHFELFYGQSIAAVKRIATVASGELLDLEIDRATLAAYLAHRFPDREKSGDGVVSELVEELLSVDILQLGALEIALESADRIVTASEADSPPSDEVGNDTRYTDVGAVRMALRHTVPDWHRRNGPWS